MFVLRRRVKGEDGFWEKSWNTYGFVDRPAINLHHVKGMLPPEILDQITSLNTQHRQLISIIYRLSRSSEITSQLILDDLTSRIKIGFAKADQGMK